MIDAELPLWLEVIGFIINTVLVATLLVMFLRIYENMIDEVL